MSTKVEKRLDAIEKGQAQIKALLGTAKFKTGSVMHDQHTMIMNTDFLLYTIKSMGEGQKQMIEQHQREKQPLFTEVNIQGSFIKSKGLQNEYPLYKKEFLEKQQKQKEEAEAKAKAEAEKTTEEADTPPGDADPPGSEADTGE